MATPRKKKAPARALSGEELDPVLLGKHLGEGSQLGPDCNPRKAIGAPQATSRRGGRRRPPQKDDCKEKDKNNSSSGSLGAFVEEGNRSFKATEGGTDLCEQTVDSRQLMKKSDDDGKKKASRGGRRPVKVGEEENDDDST